MTETRTALLAELHKNLQAYHGDEDADDIVLIDAVDTLCKLAGLAYEVDDDGNVTLTETKTGQFVTIVPNEDEHPDEFEKNFIGIWSNELEGVVSWSVDQETADQIVLALNAAGTDSQEPVIHEHPEAAWLIYADEEGGKHSQSVWDVEQSGTLIDPETGDDMELIGWTTTDPNF